MDAPTIPRSGGRWARLAAQAGTGGAGLARLRAEAEEEREALDAFLIASDPGVQRLRSSLDALPLPYGTDWRWRPPLLAARLSPPGIVAPESGTGLGASCKIFHDCPDAALILTQLRQREEGQLSRHALRLEVLGFSGDFLSLSLPLPREATNGLTRSHVLRCATEISIERGVHVFMRVNLQNGPNVDKVQHHLGWMKVETLNRHVTEFDLSETELDEDRLEHGWLDIIMERPRMNALVLRDLVVSRHLRADI